MKFSDSDFNILFISFMRTIAENLKSVLSGYELNLENDLPKSSHDIMLYIEKVAILRIRIFRNEYDINQHAENISKSDFFETIKNLLINTVSTYVNLLDETKNARKH